MMDAQQRKTPAEKSHKGPAKTAHANIRDIAKAAGVSVASVSRVMRGITNVSDGTKAKVERAVKELGYVPNAHARALTMPPNSVALVVRSITGGTYSEMTGASANEAVCRNMAFHLIVTGESRVNAQAILTDLLAQRPRVAIFVADDNFGAISDEELNKYVDHFDSMGTSLVALARPRLRLSDAISVVDYANERGTYILTQYLISLGHRDMLFVGVRRVSKVFSYRYRGFLRALEEAGIRHDSSLDLEFDSNRVTDVARIITRYRSGAPFTAVVGATDVIALDAINALQTQDVLIPECISVVGFDDMPFAGDLIVPLTTVHVPFADMGVAAVRMGLSGSKDVMMPTKLVIRKSTMPAVRM